MEAAARRAAILSRLEQAERPVSAAALAREFAVSRQIIVGDVALLRAGGADIAATPRGYVLPRESGALLRTVACVHDRAGWPGSWRSWWITAARWWMWWWSTPCMDS